MKKNGTRGILIFALCMIGALSVLHWSGAKEKMATVNSNAGSQELPIYCVSTDKPLISLSFDSAWGNEDIDEVLDILARQEVKATFFITGEWVNKFPDDVKKILAGGHDLGNYGDNHKHMTQLSAVQRRNEFMDLHNKVKELTGVEMDLFRPPYGDYNNDVILDAKACGYYPVQWSVDSLDWRDYGTDSIIETVCSHKNMTNGAIILCHNGAVYQLPPNASG